MIESSAGDEVGEAFGLSLFEAMACGLPTLCCNNGGIGENGDIQSFLDLHQISYCGSAAKASKLAMDKHLSKMIAKTESVSTPEWILIKFDNYSTQLLNENAIKFDFPYIVKPADEGSTVGLSLVNSVDEIEGAIEIAGKYSTNLLIEEYIAGRELTVGVLGSKALPIVEIISDHVLYDYDCKYRCRPMEFYGS